MSTDSLELDLDAAIDDILDMDDDDDDDGKRKTNKKKSKKRNKSYDETSTASTTTSAATTTTTTDHRDDYNDDKQARLNKLYADIDRKNDDEEAAYDKSKASDDGDGISEEESLRIANASNLDDMENDLFSFGHKPKSKGPSLLHHPKAKLTHRENTKSTPSLLSASKPLAEESTEEIWNTIVMKDRPNMRLQSSNDKLSSNVNSESINNENISTSIQASESSSTSSVAAKRRSVLKGSANSSGAGDTFTSSGSGGSAGTLDPPSDSSTSRRVRFGDADAPSMSRQLTSNTSVDGTIATTTATSGKADSRRSSRKEVSDVTFDSDDDPMDSLGLDMDDDDEPATDATFSEPSSQFKKKTSGAKIDLGITEPSLKDDIESSNSDYIPTFSSSRNDNKSSTTPKDRSPRSSLNLNDNIFPWDNDSVTRGPRKGRRAAAAAVIAATEPLSDEPSAVVMNEGIIATSTESKKSSKFVHNIHNTKAVIEPALPSPVSMPRKDPSEPLVHIAKDMTTPVLPPRSTIAEPTVVQSDFIVAPSATVASTTNDTEKVRHLQDMVSSLENKISSLKYDRDTTVRRLNDELVDNESRRRNAEAELERANVQSESKISNLNATIELLRESNRIALSDAETNFAKKTKWASEETTMRMAHIEEQLLNMEISKKSALESMSTEHALSIDALKLTHQQEIDHLKSMHATSLEHQRQEHERLAKAQIEAHNEQIATLRQASSTSRSLNELMDRVHDSTKTVETLQQRVETSHTSSLMGRELSTREAEVRAHQTAERLSQDRILCDKERAATQVLLARLEANQREQAQALERERWQFSQDTVALAAQRTAFEEECRANTMRMITERNDIARSRENIMEERKAIMLTVQEERQAAAAERAEAAKVSRALTETMDRERARTMLAQQELEERLSAVERDRVSMEEAVAALRREKERFVAEKRILSTEREEFEDEKSKLTELGLEVQRRSKEIEMLHSASAADKEIAKRLHYDAQAMDLTLSAEKARLLELSNRLTEKERHLAKERTTLQKERVHLSRRRTLQKDDLEKSQHQACEAISKATNALQQQQRQASAGIFHRGDVGDNNVNNDCPVSDVNITFPSSRQQQQPTAVVSHRGIIAPPKTKILCRELNELIFNVEKKEENELLDRQTAYLRSVVDRC